MKLVISKKYQDSETMVLSLIHNFQEEGRLLGDGARNEIRIFPLDKEEINIKSFKIPNLINKVSYRFFRQSKAERSYSYAHYLVSKEIGTPYPIGYAEETKGFFFKKSYYISEHLKSDLTYRTLVQEPYYPNSEAILRAFTRFTYSLHEKRIEFLDHSPGNTLIRLNGGNYEFFLVDLNRMRFKEMDFDARMKNFSRLTPKKEMIAVMASEYSELYARSEEEVFEKMWRYTCDFQEKFRRKKAIKKKLKFWKKS